MMSEVASARMKRDRPYWSARQGKSRATQPFDAQRALKRLYAILGGRRPRILVVG